MLLIYVGLGHRQPGELATLLGLVLPSLSTKISKMVDAGLLQRESQNEDARRVTITLTDAGLKASRQLMSAWHDSNLIDPDKFSNEEVSAFIRIGRSLTPADLEN